MPDSSPHSSPGEVEAANEYERRIAWTMADKVANVQRWLPTDDVSTARRDLASLVEQVQTLERRLRDAPLGGDGSHWVDCWRSHIDCATARVESLVEQLEATQRDLANAVYERDMHVRAGIEAERHLRKIAESYDSARIEESARVMYDIARSSVPQRDERGRILNPEWAECTIERWSPSNPAKECDA